jgi:response regulator of citrate/malate metabolism
MNFKTIIVDSDPMMLRLHRKIVEAAPGYTVVHSGSAD